MRHYELMVILDPELEERTVAPSLDRFLNVVRKGGGSIENVNIWGRRKLAYEIGHHREGTYVVETITGSGELMKEIDRRLRVTDAVIRHLAVRVDDDLRVAERLRDERKATQARRRTARGLPPEPSPSERRGEPHDDQDEDRMGMEGAEVQR